jgi:arginine utilization protein RocB
MFPSQVSLDLNAPARQSFGDRRTVNCIEQIDQSKKAGKPISLRLQPNFELLADLRVLQIQFLADEGAFPASFPDQKAVWTAHC